MQPPPHKKDEILPINIRKSSMNIEIDIAAVVSKILLTTYTQTHVILLYNMGLNTWEENESMFIKINFKSEILKEILICVYWNKSFFGKASLERKKKNLNILNAFLEIFKKRFIFLSLFTFWTHLLISWLDLSTIRAFKRNLYEEFNKLMFIN